MADGRKQSETGPENEPETLTAGSARSGAPGATAPLARIGPYRLRQKLGEGGMGEVWAAEQEEPVRRKVALKLIRAGMDSREVLARFESERQALALMSHPSIARIFDAGVSEQGRPFFAMEYVEGEPITTYCDRHRLGAGERLELFRQVCDGVQHAHQKGIIHRDLKPSNVLVTVQDERPVPKIIDFGVAKATARRLTEKTIFTEFGQLIGTPEYMSPEQAEMTGLDIDTRTDVYSLGALLYELLAGVPPFDPRELRSAGFAEIQRRIRDDEPLRPSTRLTKLGDTSTQVAERRQSDPSTLSRRLRGDLDWIVMKALEKDRTRRYGSASELAEEIGRHLRHEPVVAGPPSTAYRACKFVRRHRAGVVAAVLVLLALIAGTVGTTLGLLRARQAERLARTEAETAHRVSDFLVELFEVSDPSEARGNAVTAREILDRGAERIELQLGDEPAVQGRLLHTVGRVYRSLGLLRPAGRLLDKALQLRERSLASDDIEIAESLEELGSVESLVGDYDRAEEHLERALAIRRASQGPDHPAVAATLARLAFHFTERRQFDEAEEVYQMLVPLQERILGGQHLDLAMTLYGRARNSIYRGSHEEAVAQARRALAIREEGLPADHPDLARTIYLLAGTARELHRVEESIELFGRALAIQERVLGPEHLDVALTQYHLALGLKQQARLGEAEVLMRRALATGEKLLGPDHWRYGAALHGFAHLRREQGHLEEAIGHFLRVLEIQKSTIGPDDPALAYHLNDLADAYLEGGRAAEAEALWQQVLAMERSLALGAHERIRCRRGLAHLYAEQSRQGLAAQQLEQALALSIDALGAEHSATLEIRQALDRLGHRRDGA